MTEPICGDPTCEGPGCTQEAIDAWLDRQWHEAGEIVAAMLGRTYEPGSGVGRG